MTHYAAVIGNGARLEAMMRFGELPKDACPKAVDANRIAHACIVFDDGSFLCAGDIAPGQPHKGISGVSIVMNYPDVSEARRVFDTLAEGGDVTMPFDDVFYAEKSGMLVDRFGTSWAINAVVNTQQA